MRHILSIIFFINAHLVFGQGYTPINIKDENTLKIVFRQTFDKSELERLNRPTQLTVKCYIDKLGNVTSASILTAVNSVFDSINKQLLLLNIQKYCKYKVPRNYLDVSDSLRYTLIVYYRR